MKELIYKTRGNSEAEHKEKVYFTCHLKDFSLYFEEIAGDILACQNCAIWYFDGTEEERKTKEHLKRLDGMQLLVIPITYRFLCDAESGAHRELSYAISHHIPVLPLMQEEGLEAQFNRVCGEMHILSKLTKSRGESYQEKLAKFLSNVLVGDALAEKVRAAFDAYIFLSYRKKDSAYADRLMKMVYENEVCRDIAMWYDEYLIPGENFNDSIRAALEKSNLFMLAVTPNLLEKMNYVMKDEYPLARNTGKYIFPVELVETDRKLLSDFYQEIPELVPAKEQDKFQEALLCAIKEIASEPKDSSPEHCFFIGLAYLDGIDVPKNAKRALELISYAAEQGMQEAVIKLMVMYQHGKGVERNLQKACKWAEKLLVLLEKNYQKEQNQTAGMDLLNGYIYVAELYGNAGNGQQEYNCFMRANDHSISMLEAFGTDGVVIRNAHLQMLIAEHDKAAWNFASARKHLEDTESLVRQMIKLNRMPAVEVLLIEVLELLGDINMEDGLYPMAVSCYQEALELTESQEQSRKKTPEGLLSYGGLLRRLACAQLKADDEKSANSNFRKMLSLAKNAFAEYRTEGLQYLLCLGYDGVASVYKEVRPNEAVKQLKKALKEARSLVQFADHPRNQRLIFTSLCDICEVLTGRDNEGAMPYAEEMVAVAKRIAEHTDSPEAKRDLWIAYRRMADLLKSRQQPDQALSTFQLAHEVLHELAKTEQDPDSVRNLVEVCWEIGEILKEAEELESAKDYFQEAERSVNGLIVYYENALKENAAAYLESKLEPLYFIFWDILITLASISKERQEIMQYAKAAYDLGIKISCRFDRECELYYSAKTYYLLGLAKENRNDIEKAQMIVLRLYEEYPKEEYRQMADRMETVLARFE